MVMMMMMITIIIIIPFRLFCFNSNHSAYVCSAKENMMQNVGPYIGDSGDFVLLLGPSECQDNATN
jgi:hypothetical protein